MQTSPANRYIPLDGLRGVAAIGIVAFHVASGRFVWLQSFYLLVDFFFVLSGFVLWPSIPHERVGLARSSGRFIVKRVFRFWPLVIAALVFAMVVLPGIRPLFGQTPWDSPAYGFPPLEQVGVIAAAFALLQIVVTPALFFDFPLWSLSAEWFANVIATPLAWVKHGLGILLLVVVGYVLLAYGLHSDAFWIYGADGPVAWGPIRGWESLGRALIGFGLGLLLRKYLDRLTGLRNWWMLVISLALIATMPVWVIATHATTFTYNITLWSAPIFALFILQITRFNVLPGTRWGRFLEFLGVYSFGIYVFHGPIRSVWLLFGAPSVATLPSKIFVSTYQIIGITALSIAVTYLARRFVEAPIQKWGKRVVGRMPVDK